MLSFRCALGSHGPGWSTQCQDYAHRHQTHSMYPLHRSPLGLLLVSTISTPGAMPTSPRRSGGWGVAALRLSCRLFGMSFFLVGGRSCRPSLFPRFVWLVSL